MGLFLRKSSFFLLELTSLLEFIGEFWKHPNISPLYPGENKVRILKNIGFCHQSILFLKSTKTSDYSTEVLGETDETFIAVIIFKAFRQTLKHTMIFYSRNRYNVSMFQLLEHILKNLIR
jgi:hypothetical protein